MVVLHRLLLVSLIFAGILLIAAGTLTAQDNQLTFVLIGGPPASPFFGTMMKGMDDACALLKATCAWETYVDFSMADVNRTWDKVLETKPTAIGVWIFDRGTLAGAINKALEQGIPLGSFNARDPEAGTAEAFPVQFYVGSDETRAGASNARRVLAEAKTDGVTIQQGVCFNHAPGYAPMEDRCNGVKSVFDAEGIGLDMEALSRQEAIDVKVLDRYFTAHPETNAAFMLGPDPATVLNKYIQQAGLQPRQLYATTHDTSTEIFQMIKDGYLLQAIDQQPYMQGFQTVMLLFLNSRYLMQPGDGQFFTYGVVDLSNVDPVAEMAKAGYR